MSHTITVLGEFASPAGAAAAVRRLSAAGFAGIDVAMPYPAPEVMEALPALGGGRAAPRWMLAAGVIGIVGFLAIQDYGLTFSYPQNVGGRPTDAWPTFIPNAIEVGAMLAVAVGTLVAIVMGRLPALDHPAFAAPDFARASQDRFFVEIETTDKDEARRAARLLGDVDALSVTEVVA